MQFHVMPKLKKISVQRRDNKSPALRYDERGIAEMPQDGFHWLHVTQLVKEAKKQRRFGITPHTSLYPYTSTRLASTERLNSMYNKLLASTLVILHQKN